MNTHGKGLQFKITCSLAILFVIILGCLTTLNVVNLKKNILH